MDLRPFTPLQMVLTVCGKCFSEDPGRKIEYERDVLQGNLILMDGKVYLRRHCRRGHGEVISLYEEDYGLWEYLQQWRVPTKYHISDTVGNNLPIPMGYLNGLGELQTQHSCIFLLDITENCNLKCPTCFADSGPSINRFVRLDHIMRSLDAVIEREGGRIDVLMLSGGEPTVHPDIIEIIKEATRRNVTRVLLNTNGIRIAREDKLLSALAKLRNRVEVYLQFDGFSLESHLYHRGEDLREVKKEAVRRLAEARIFTTLVMAVAQGVNDHEVGQVAEFAFQTDYIGGVSFQPIFGSGRANTIDPMKRVTTTGVLRLLEQQTGGSLVPQDFIALPCSHPDCCTLTYFIKGDEGQLTSIPSLLGHDRLKANLSLVSNRVAYPDANPAIQAALTGMMSETTTITRPELVDYVLNICENCELGLSSFVKSVTNLLLKREDPVETIAKRMKRITIKSFMDGWTMNVERLQQCCVHVGTTEGDSNPIRIPFCARQLFQEARDKTLTGRVRADELIQVKRNKEVRI
ncbi:MAG: radical SAM protein [Chloroflexi bacterium]|uniref:Radical SAM protein n=1 Tax=Candidatus Chlorohelix allophototropha TaxID=3003348 RepID=A0A8T7M2Y7_9CHLR|nr:radical SAM protein [Chloroflexota bacterium]WJW66011.1 radical SAM protein [Chloroflexota bacterium L227-S17]